MSRPEFDEPLVPSTLHLPGLQSKAAVSYHGLRALPRYRRHTYQMDFPGLSTAGAGSISLWRMAAVRGSRPPWPSGLQVPRPEYAAQLAGCYAVPQPGKPNRSTLLTEIKQHIYDTPGKDSA